MSLYGYVRVSSHDQNEGRQMLALSELNIPPKNIFVDKMSGKDFNRPSYQRLLSVLKPDDVLYIKSIDRLGRNYVEIQNEWRRLVQEKKIDIVVIDMPLLDTRNGKDLLGTFLSDIVLQVLSFVAENERINIRERQAEGIAAARKRGVRFGRPELEPNKQFYRAAKNYLAGECSMSAAARECGMSATTFRRKIQKLYRATYEQDQTKNDQE